HAECPSSVSRGPEARAIDSFIRLLGGSSYSARATALANAEGWATLTKSAFSRTGKPITYARWRGLSSMRTMPRPEPFTSQRPPIPCTPRLSGEISSSDPDSTAERGNRERKAQPIRTSTASASTDTYDLEGSKPRALDSTRHHGSKLMGKRTEA